MHPAQLLLEAGAEVDARDSVTEQAALHWAAVRGAREATDLLLTSGASLTLVDSQVSARCGRAGGAEGGVGQEAPGPI